MPNKMLIDAAHPEETRVVVVKGNRVEDFDYESANKKQLRGNIYLAKVTRVEPSLQAAFVDYGGNRHGFLAFTEIHPDYYQIPVADRQALLEAEAEEESRASAAEAAEDDAAAGRKRRRGRRGRGRPESAQKARGDEAQPPVEAEAESGAPESEGETGSNEGESDIAMEASDLTHEVSEAAERESDPDSEADELSGSVISVEEADDDDDPAEIVGQRVVTTETNGEALAETVDSVGSEDALEEVPERARRRRGRPYKIQEVIRRRQIILVQVVKEERGTKGAALTTYLSLAGRYTVLMPNTARGGGISRKITNPTDRKRLREIAGELEVPEGMGLIIRTAGAQRTKTEIKRDYDYLLRLWETVRDLTLKSTAPNLVYEEGSLIKRSIRDLYNKDIDEVLVAGDDAYREAKDFIRMLMPSHTKNVKPYKEPEPVFIRFQVERQLAAMFSPQVVLKSGGYIVINQTEALVAVDVNSGKATREHNIEDTALKTNLEAAEEVARQLRLRDLAGLIVIDFIDMDERRNSHLVEKRLKESLRNDRARIQVGRISHFGLMEMSRQRLRTGMLEGSTSPCTMCQATGIVRSVESIALDVLRSLEDRLITDGVMPLVATTAVDVALYILNQKRAHLKDIEQRYQIPITVTADENLHVSQFTIERSSAAEAGSGESSVVQMDWAHHEAPPAAASATGTAETEEQNRQRSKRRRRKRRGPEQEDEAPEALAEDGEAVEEQHEEPEAKEAQSSESAAQNRNKSRRRGRRGGRRGRGAQGSEQAIAGADEPAADASSEAAAPGHEDRDETPPPESKAKPRSNGDGRRSSRKAGPSRRKAAEPPVPIAEPPVAAPEARAESESKEDDSPPRRGWWQR